MLIEQIKSYVVKYEKWLLLGILVIIGFFCVGIIILMNLPSRPPKPSAQPTPTPIHISDLQVTSNLPTNDSINIGIYPTISATFSRTVTPPEQQAIHIQFSPETSFNTQWNNNILTLTTNTPLLTDTKYTIAIIIPGLSPYKWSFTTTNPSNIPLQDQQKAQSQADKNFGTWQQNIITNYPWYNQLPLMTSSYYVYFDLNQKKFIARVYLDPSSSLSPEEQINQQKPAIETALQNLGIDLTQYSVTWNAVSK